MQKNRCSVVLDNQVLLHRFILTKIGTTAVNEIYYLKLDESYISELMRLQNPFSYASRYVSIARFFMSFFDQTPPGTFFARVATLYLDIL